MTPCMVAHGVAASFVLEIAPRSDQINLSCSDPPQRCTFFLPPHRRRALQSFGELAPDEFLDHVSSLSFVSAAGAPDAPGPPRDVLQILRSLPDIQRSAYPTVSIQILL